MFVGSFEQSAPCFFRNENEDPALASIDACMQSAPCNFFSGFVIFCKAKDEYSYTFSRQKADTAK
jgi:hypothetical protein